MVLFAWLIFFWQVQELEKEILDAKEKFEFYRAKMQELVSMLLAIMNAILD